MSATRISINSAEILTMTKAVLVELQAQEDRAYNVRDIGDALIDRYPVCQELGIEPLARTLGLVLARQAKVASNGLIKERARISGNIGGNYLYRAA